MNLRLRNRFAVIPSFFLIAQVLGYLQTSWWAAALIGIGFAAAFTFLSERIARRLLFGRIGNKPIIWYLLHLAYETAIAWGLLAAFSHLCGASIVFGLGFYLIALFVWVFLCRETIVILPLQLMIEFSSNRS